MGSSITARWVDGPTQVMVKNVIRKFEDVRRDQYSGEILSGGNMYIFASREYSKGSGILLGDIDLRGEQEVDFKKLASNAFDYLRNFARAYEMQTNELGSTILVQTANQDLERVKNQFIALGYKAEITENKLFISSNIN
jgi:hypothetical protein